ncbi:curli assembly protein CsgF [Asticcacaulis taihuensis]|uniref:Curli production assembly/transport component CsgF n=1 Tax=Asticcacaulis taihuensis TaxID=260084 RepID=A0A1G4SJ29_9CAUL|nr:curli assembly protein CsgF [Asticcacaulis taihuensis]SCW68947.1 curli production assembly/transport component CsgF [Asticcacaulis taihuensis]
MKNVGNRVTMGCAILSVAALVVVAAPAFAQKLTYTPTSPTFGGNPFNSSHLLGVANGQNDYKDPESKTTTSQSDLFASQLESRLLSAFSAQLTDAIFGENAQQSGTFTLGDQTVTFNRDLENVNIQITNGATGELTNITVPLYLQVN